MNGHCSSCPVESECGYPYKPTDCCNQRKFRPIQPKGLFVGLIAEHPGLSDEMKAMDELTDERILELAHRIATKYTHRSDPTYCSYGFVKHTMIDFARAIVKEIRG